MSRRGRVVLAVGALIAAGFLGLPALRSGGDESSRGREASEQAAQSVSRSAPVCQDRSAHTLSAADLRAVVARARRSAAERSAGSPVVVLDGRGYNYRPARGVDELPVPLPDVPATR